MTSSTTLFLLLGLLIRQGLARPTGPGLHLQPRQFGPDWGNCNICSSIASFLGSECHGDPIEVCLKTCYRAVPDLTACQNCLGSSISPENEAWLKQAFAYPGADCANVAINVGDECTVDGGYKGLIDSEKQCVEDRRCTDDNGLAGTRVFDGTCWLTAGQPCTIDGKSGTTLDGACKENGQECDLPDYTKGVLVNGVCSQKAGTACKGFEDGQDRDGVYDEAGAICLVKGQLCTSPDGFPGKRGDNPAECIPTAQPGDACTEDGKNGKLDAARVCIVIKEGDNCEVDGKPGKGDGDGNCVLTIGDGEECTVDGVKGVGKDGQCAVAVKPTAGTPCTTADGKTGKWNDNSMCQPDSGEPPSKSNAGTPCTSNSKSGITDDQGDCVVTQPVVGNTPAPPSTGGSSSSSSSSGGGGSSSSGGGGSSSSGTSGSGTSSGSSGSTSDAWHAARVAPAAAIAAVLAVVLL